MYYALFFICGLIVLSMPSSADDIAADVKTGGGSQKNGGYFELGLLGGYVYTPYNFKANTDLDGYTLSFDVSGVYRKNGFFAEAVFATQDGINLGYNLWQNDSYSVDFLAASLSGFYNIDFEGLDEPQDTEEARNEDLYERHTLYTGTGIRFTSYIDEYVLQYRLVTDTFDNNGVMSTLRVGRAWQYRNWNFHGIVSAVYTSRATNQYRYGVDESEATTANPTFYPEASLSYSVMLGMTRPLSEKWILRGIAGWEHTPDEIKDSNFVDNHDRILAGISIVRVFSSGK